MKIINPVSLFDYSFAGSISDISHVGWERASVNLFCERVPFDKYTQRHMDILLNCKERGQLKYILAKNTEVEISLVKLTKKGKVYLWIEGLDGKDKVTSFAIPDPKQWWTEELRAEVRSGFTALGCTWDNWIVGYLSMDLLSSVLEKVKETKLSFIDRVLCREKVIDLSDIATLDGNWVKGEVRFIPNLFGSDNIQVVVSPSPGLFLRTVFGELSEICNYTRTANFTVSKGQSGMASAVVCSIVHGFTRY